MPRILLVIAALGLSMLSAEAAEPINIGALLPMTGSVAAFGEMAWDGINTAKQIKPEALGRPIEIKLADTKSEKVDSANAVSRLIEKDKVVAIIGELISGNTIAASDHAERSKIPMVSPTATNPLVNQGKKFVFRVCFIDPEQGRVAAKLALDTFTCQNSGYHIRHLSGLLCRTKDFLPKRIYQGWRKDSFGNHV